MIIFLTLPVHEKWDGSDEVHDDADVGISVDSDREGHEHDANDGKIGDTIQPYQLVYEVPILELGPHHDDDVDNEDDRVGHDHNGPVFRSLRKVSIDFKLRFLREFIKHNRISVLIKHNSYLFHCFEEWGSQCVNCSL